MSYMGNGAAGWDRTNFLRHVTTALYPLSYVRIRTRAYARRREEMDLETSGP